MPTDFCNVKDCCIPMGFEGLGISLYCYGIFLYCISAMSYCNRHGILVHVIFSSLWRVILDGAYNRWFCTNLRLCLKSKWNEKLWMENKQICKYHVKCKCNLFQWVHYTKEIISLHIWTSNFNNDFVFFSLQCKSIPYVLFWRRYFFHG